MTVALDHERPVASDELEILRSKIENLECALRTNRTIGMAMGILVERYKLSVQEAFDCLVLVSQGKHRKLRDVASDIVFTGEVPAL